MAKNLLDVNNLSKTDIDAIWHSVHAPVEIEPTRVAWSFEGNGIRTRTTFIQAFKQLNANVVELPNLLKTGEQVEDLAGYLDDYYDIYVIRDSNHERLTQFANVSKRPVINAMSSLAHPCEVLTDGYYLNEKFSQISKPNVLLWGPTTNVFRSWLSLASVMPMNLLHYCPEEYFIEGAQAKHISTGALLNLEDSIDVVVTDAWPSGFSDETYQLSLEFLRSAGSPLLLPTPPVTQGKEVSFSLSEYSAFVGYSQKSLLLPVQKAILNYFLNKCPIDETG